MFSRSVMRRLLKAAVIYAALFASFGALHDYPQLRDQMNKVRLHDPVAERRQWLTFFYFINEAGNGLKFFLTGNEKYMFHYPSPSHLLASRTARALKGDWQMQVTVARMYYRGEFAPRDPGKARQWLRLARDSAPDEESARQISAMIDQWGGGAGAAGKQTPASE